MTDEQKQRLFRAAYARLEEEGASDAVLERLVSPVQGYELIQLRTRSSRHRSTAYVGTAHIEADPEWAGRALANLLATD